jgi:ribonuclease HI
MTTLRLYTDGSCPAPGAIGGWAWILVGGHSITTGSGTTSGPSTHQRCELTAAIEGLTYLVASGVREVELLSDSRYVVGGMSSTGCTGCTGWAHAAAEREWRTTRRKPLANRELWERLLELDGRLAVSWRLCAATGRRRTQATTPANREVDVLAVEARRGFVVPPQVRA